MSRRFEDPVARPTESGECGMATVTLAPLAGESPRGSLPEGSTLDGTHEIGVAVPHVPAFHTHRSSPAVRYLEPFGVRTHGDRFKVTHADLQKLTERPPCEPIREVQLFISRCHIDVGQATG